jgi:histidinol-phosphate aminotransferase
MSSNRRQWLKQTSFAFAGLGLSNNIFAAEEKRPHSGAILLNSNENAYGPSASSRKAMTEALLHTNRYPDEQLPKLKEKIAAFWKVKPENILLGAGSSEILGLVSLYVSVQKGNIITADPSYRVWNGQPESFGLNFVRIPLNTERNLDLNKMLSQINDDTRMMYVCNPNNPTGIFVENQKLKDFVLESSKKCMVLADEAYTEFAGLPSLAEEAVKNPNITVAKTFSKIYGLAGARVGYAIAHPDTVKKLASLQTWPGMSVSMVTSAAASAAIDDQDFVKDCAAKTAKAREMCYSCFKELGFEYIPSNTSFILFNIEKIKGDYPAQMQAKNIFVQYRNHFGGKWCRVSMGTLEEMQEFCSALKSIAG